MDKATKKYLLDIVTTCDEISSFLIGQQREDYANNLLLRRGIERDIAIIGEALSQIRMTDEVLVERIPASHYVIGMRNRLIHAYDIVNDAIVWDTATRDVPQLRAEVLHLLSERR